MPKQYHGPERRTRARTLEDKVIELERDLRHTSAELRAVTACLNGYKSFIEVLKKREEQKIQFRATLIEKGVTAAMLSAASGAGLIVWYAFTAWLKGH